MSSYEINGINELLGDIRQIANTFPKEAEKRIQKIGNQFKKIVREKGPDSGTNSKRKLKKSWKSKVKGYRGEDLELEIWSTSPHFHLVDRGHALVDSKGNKKGFVQGKHFLEATVQEVEATVVPKELDSFLTEITKKLDK